MENYEFAYYELHATNQLAWAGITQPSMLFNVIYLSLHVCYEQDNQIFFYYTA